MKKFFAFCLTLCLMLVLGGCVAGISNYFPFGANASAGVVPLDVTRYREQVKYDIPSVPAGQYRLYGSLTANDGKSAWKDSPFGLGGDESAWFYLDVDSATHTIKNAGVHIQGKIGDEGYYVYALNEPKEDNRRVTFNRPYKRPDFGILGTKNTTITIQGYYYRYIDINDYYAPDDDISSRDIMSGEIVLNINGNLRALKPGASLPGTYTLMDFFDHKSTGTFEIRRME